MRILDCGNILVFVLLLAQSRSVISLDGLAKVSLMKNSLGRNIIRRSMFGHVEPIPVSLIGVPVGGLAGIVGSMLGVGGGVIMVP